MKALLKHNRQSPRKTRQVADLIRGKSVDEALLILENTPKKATRSLSKVLKSAVANAQENNGKKEDSLYIKEILIDEGFTMKRFRARARGAAHPIRKRTSHISIKLGELEGKPVDKDSESVVDKKVKDTKK